MKILELCLSPDLGGLELYMARSARALAAVGHEVIAVVGEESRLAGYLERAGVRYEVLPRRSRALPLMAARRLARLIDAADVDLVHLHWTKDLPLAALAKQLSRRRPALVSTRQMQITRPKRDPYHAWLYRRVDRHLAITRNLAERMRRCLPADLGERVQALYYGVPAPSAPLAHPERIALRAELGVPAGAFLAGLFGRIKHYKGQHLLVDAVARSAAAGGNLHALIVGRAMEPDYLHRLKAWVQDEGLSERVIFRDFVDEPQRLMQACDAVVLATVEETFGLVLVEAMRAGVAVVGSDRGGVPEIIDHGETGLLFDSGRSESLYQQLRYLAEDAALRTRLAAAGRAAADARFDEDDHFRRLEAIFRDVAG